MDINKMKALSYDELRALYRNFYIARTFQKQQSILLCNTFYLEERKQRSVLECGKRH
jgi:hypothetical protein